MSCQTIQLYYIAHIAVSGEPSQLIDSGDLNINLKLSVFAAKLLRFFWNSVKKFAR
jgi:hypothetical protein